MRQVGFFCALAALAAATPASATVVTSTLPEFNGTGANGNTFVGTFNYVIPVGEVIVGATFNSTWGNSTVNSSSVGTVTVDGVTVGTCASSSDPCWLTGIDPFSYNFTAGQFSLLADGSASLYYNQTDCCFIRLGQSTLTITTAVAGAVPEPSTSAMMLLGFALVGGAVRYGRRQPMESIQAM